MQKKFLSVVLCAALLLAACTAQAAASSEVLQETQSLYKPIPEGIHKRSTETPLEDLEAALRDAERTDAVSADKLNLLNENLTWADVLESFPDAPFREQPVDHTVSYGELFYLGLQSNIMVALFGADGNAITDFDTVIEPGMHAMYGRFNQAGTEFAEVSFILFTPEAAGPTLIPGCGLEIMETPDGKILLGLTAGTPERYTSVTALLYEGFEVPNEEDTLYKCTSADGKDLDLDDAVGTGTVLGLAEPGVYEVYYTIVVRGDLTGSGLISISDIVIMAQALTGQKKLTKLELLAADFNNSGAIDVSDLTNAAKLLAGQTGDSGANETTVQQQCLKLTNALRMSEGQAPLRTTAELNDAAAVRAVEMAATGVFSHTRPNGEVCFTVFEGDFTASGENIAWNGRNVSSDQIAALMVQQWTDSPGHHANMVSPLFTYMGSGFAQASDGTWYGCQLFTNSPNITWIDDPQI